MARRSMKAKIQPAVMKFAFSVPAGTNYIDLSQAASILNRRFYRQGLNWAVSHFTVYKPTPTESGASGIGINKLPQTWVLSNAWEKGFRNWQRQQKETLEDGTQESVKAKFNDFKIFATTTHAQAGASANLLPVDSANNTATAGEWEYSQVVVPNYGTPGNNWEPYITAVGDYVTSGATQSISLIKAYESSRSTPQSPDPSVPGALTNSDNIYRALFDVGDNNEDVLENVIGKNNDLPYVQDDYPGGDTQLPALQPHDAGYFNAGTHANKLTLEGGTFPCGLIEVFAQESCTLLVTMVPGSHRGYLAESMTEM